MNNDLDRSIAEGDLWTTSRVAHFLGISRQAINKRVRNRKLLGYRGKGTTLFPAWQFDPQTCHPRPEVEEFLAAFADGEYDPGVIARWSTTPDPDRGVTPVELLRGPETRKVALGLASSFRVADSVAPEEERAAADDPAAPVSPDPGESEEAFAKPVTRWIPERADSAGPRHAILMAAADLFARKGPAKVTLREVAAEAGVTYGLIHRFFKSKENLLTSVMQLFVEYAAVALSEEGDVYAAIDNSFGANVDSGQFGRMLMWSICEGATPERLFRSDIRSRGYRHQVESLWRNPVPPPARTDFDSRVVAALIALIGATWDPYAPYLTTLADNSDRTPEEVRQEVTDILKVLAYATRPHEQHL